MYKGLIDQRFVGSGDRKGRSVQRIDRPNTGIGRGEVYKGLIDQIRGWEGAKCTGD